MGLIILKTPDDVSKYADSIMDEADQNKNELGFWPKSAYVEQIEKANLWVCVDDQSRGFMGYLLFGGKYPGLRVYQLFVLDFARGKGIGSKLINGLVEYGENHGYLTITAKVAADLKANKFWGRQGFSIVEQQTGSNTSGRIINKRIRELDSPSLFSSLSDLDIQKKEINYQLTPSLSNRSYVLDLNIFFDIVKKRKDQDAARIIISAAMNNEIRALVTPEFENELLRHSAGQTDPVLEFAVSLPKLNVVEDDVIDSIKLELRRIIFAGKPARYKNIQNDESDLTHLAYCVHYRATGFLTREKAILRTASVLSKKYAIDVLSPADLIASDSSGNNDQITVAPRECGGVLEIMTFMEHDREIAETFLIEQGVLGGDVSSILNPSKAKLSRETIVTKVGNVINGMMVWENSKTGTPGVRAKIYIQENSEYFENILDHFLELLNRSGQCCRFSQINLMFLRKQNDIIETLVNRGFRLTKATSAFKDHEEYAKLTYRGYVDDGMWPKFVKDFHGLTGHSLTPQLPKYKELKNSGVVAHPVGAEMPVVAPLFKFETMISPGFLFPKDRKSVIVPIRREFAKNLILDSVGQLDWLPSEAALLRIEKAYFMKPGRQKLFEKGGIVIFYESVSGGGIGHAIGVARITYSGVITVEQALVLLSRQGVLSKEELVQRSNSQGFVLAFTFDNFMAFPNPVDYKFLKANNYISGANLVTVEGIMYTHTVEILKKAFLEVKQ